jgi:hypothetical protein
MVDVGQHLRDALLAAEWQREDLLIADMALGGTFDLQRLESLIDGTRQPTRPEYDRLIHALNERMTDLGRDRPFRYAEDLPHHFSAR